jgi:methylated-DNA-[protein]-cysteine S-methyltransferase
MTTPYAYEQIPSGFGSILLVCALGRGSEDPLLKRVVLPLEGVETKERILVLFPGTVPGTAGRKASVMASVSRRIRRFLAGETVDFPLNALDMNACGAFQQRVLKLAVEIPRGKVSTYGALAEKLGQPGAARAVGTALAQNPFPLVIPCHRVIRADGTLGGFGGGLKMKRALLEAEGVRFDSDGKIIKDYII